MSRADERAERRTWREGRGERVVLPAILIGPTTRGGPAGPATRAAG